MTQKTYSFKDQLSKGEEYERKLDEYFSYWYNIEPVDIDGQRQGIDRIFRNNDRIIAVEYKTDFLTQNTGNVFIETMSVTEMGRYGWAWTCKADILVYLCIPETIFLANPYDIRDHIPLWTSVYGVRMVKNKSYHSQGIPLPIKEFAKVAKVRKLS
jgi:hypothetical protein